MKEQKIVVFDFDKTLTNYDTMLPFFRFCCQTQPWRYLMLPFFFALKVGSKLGFWSVKTEKNWGLKLFCPKNNIEFKILCTAFSKKIEVNEIYKESLAKHVKSNDRVIVISASLQDYLRPLFEKKIVVIGTILKVEGGKRKRIIQHSFKDKKPVLLKKIGVQHIDLLYTDSEDDIFMVRMADKVRWVKNGRIVKEE